MMKLKKGYKQTEVGVIPEDWEIISLGELLSFKNGLNKEKEFFGQGTPIVNYMDVFNYSGIKKKHLKGKVTLTTEEIKNYSAKIGDVFFTRTSETQLEIGISSVLIEEVENCVFSGFILRGRPKNNLLDINFAKYCFSTNYIRKQIISSSSYTTRALTNGRLLSDVKLKKPSSIPEQKAIAQVLNDTDKLIQNLKTLIVKKKAIKQGAMQELLTGKKRLKGFDDKWAERKLGEVLSFQVGHPFLSIFFNEKDGVRLIKNRDLKNDGKIVLYSDKDFPTEYIVKNGDVLIGMDGDFIPCLWKKGKGLLNQRIGRLVSNKVDLTFFYYYLIKPLKDIEEITSSTTVKHLSHSDIEDLILPIPTRKEQKAIAQILSDMDLEIEALETQLQKTQNLKQGMMQELLTGKIRLIKPVYQSAKKESERMSIAAEPKAVYKKEN